jgi:hypothetical protein
MLVQATNANNSNFLVRVLVDLQQVLLPQIYWFECWFKQQVLMHSNFLVKWAEKQQMLIILSLVNKLVI